MIQAYYQHFIPQSTGAASTTVASPVAITVTTRAATGSAASSTVSSPVAIPFSVKTGAAGMATTVSAPVAITITPWKAMGRPSTFTTAIVVGDSISNGFSGEGTVQSGPAKVFGITSGTFYNSNPNVNPTWHTGSSTAPFPGKSVFNASIDGMSALEVGDHPFTDARATYSGVVDLMVINIGGNDRLDDYTSFRAEQATTFTADAGTNVCTLPAGFDMPNTGDVVLVDTSGTLPAPLATSTGYFIIRLTATTYKLATTYANAIAGTPVIDITTAGTGTHSWTPVTVGGTLPDTQLQLFEDNLVAIGSLGGQPTWWPNRGVFTTNMPIPKCVLIVGEWELAGTWGATQFTHAQMLTACQNAVTRILATNNVHAAAYVYVGADADQGFRPDGSSLKGVDTAIPGADPDPYNGDGTSANWVHPSDIGNNEVWAPTLRAGINTLMGTADAGVVVATPVAITVTPRAAVGSAASTTVASPVAIAVAVQTATGSAASSVVAAPVAIPFTVRTATGSAASSTIASPVAIPFTVQTAVGSTGGTGDSTTVSSPVAIAVTLQSATGSAASSTVATPVAVPFTVQTGTSSAASVVVASPVAIPFTIQTATGATGSGAIVATPVTVTFTLQAATGSAASIDISAPVPIPFTTWDAVGNDGSGSGPVHTQTLGIGHDLPIYTYIA